MTITTRLIAEMNQIWRSGTSNQLISTHVDG